MSNDFFKMRGIVKQYQMGNEVQTILKGIDLDIEEGEFLSSSAQVGQQANPR